MGEPINPEAWQWYYTVVGEKRCPIVDTFWQTETVSHSWYALRYHNIHIQKFVVTLYSHVGLKTFLTGCSLGFQGGHVLTPLPAATPMKPGSAVSKLKCFSILVNVFIHENSKSFREV